MRIPSGRRIDRRADAVRNLHFRKGIHAALRVFERSKVEGHALSEKDARRMHGVSVLAQLVPQPDCQPIDGRAQTGLRHAELHSDGIGEIVGLGL